MKHYYIKKNDLNGECVMGEAFEVAGLNSYWQTVDCFVAPDRTAAVKHFERYINPLSTGEPMSRHVKTDKTASIESVENGYLLTITEPVTMRRRQFIYPSFDTLVALLAEHLGVLGAEEHPADVRVLYHPAERGLPCD